MAENNSPKTNTGILAKAQKRLSRTKTKVLQNLGKADKTKDEAFNNNVTQIEELQERTHPLHKELHHYIHCAKNLHQASKSLQNSFQTVYEDDWTDKDLILEHFKTHELLWSDYLQNLQDSVTTPLNGFLQHFPAFKAKVSKRGRKLVDYDNARHQLEVLNAAKKRDEAKIEKAQDDLKEAKRIYDELNHELLVEMPAFYKSRCHFISNLYTSLFGADFLFHSEIGKVSASIGDTCQKLASQSEPMDFKLNTSMSVNSENGTSGMSSPTTPNPSEPPTSPAGFDSHQSPLYLNQAILEEKQAKKQLDNNINGGSDDDDDDDDNDTDSEVVQSRDDSPASSKVGSLKGSLEKPKEENSYVKSHDDDDDGGDGDDNDANDKDADQGTKDKGDSNVYEEPASPTVTPRGTNGMQNGKGGGDHKDKDKADGVDDDDDDDDDDDENNLYTDTPLNTPVHEPPPGTLYQVQATHRYTGEDVDELNFEPGEMIYVIKFENSDEQDDGWQMGIKQSDGIKGVFPENFTRKI